MPAGVRTVRIDFKPGVKEQFAVLAAVRPALKDKLETFLEFKTTIPPRVLPAGFSDHALGDQLAGYRECHLAGNVLLVYILQNDVLSLLKLVDHDALRGGRQKATAKQLKNKKRRRK